MIITTTKTTVTAEAETIAEAMQLLALGNGVDMLDTIKIASEKEF